MSADSSKAKKIEDLAWDHKTQERYNDKITEVGGWLSRVEGMKVVADKCEGGCRYIRERLAPGMWKTGVYDSSGRLEYFRKAGVQRRKAGVPYSAGGRLEYDAGRLEYCTVQVEG
jgi:hypothetical protein